LLSGAFSVFFGPAPDSLRVEDKMTDEGFVDFKCPHCGDVVSFPDTCAGLVQECPNCTESVIVPKDGSETGRALPLPITTPRLVLRRLSPHDWRDLLECLSDDELFRYVDGRPLDEAEILRWIEYDSLVKLTTPNQAFCLGIAVQETKKLIGYLSLSLDHPHLKAVFTVFVNRGYQRNGFASEAVAAVLDFCFAVIGLHRVAVSCDSRNMAACRMLEKVGMRREGEFLKDAFVNGEWINTVWFAMLDEESRLA
jgi:RimJ/RimL family protein N-acetyltransferase